jgi:hypothetical protein
VAPDDTASITQGLSYIIESRQDHSSAIDQKLALLREPQTPRCTLDQEHSQPAFEMSQPLGDSWRRYVERSRRRRKRYRTRDYNKEAQIFC